jgi:hypothetical protein
MVELRAKVNMLYIFISKSQLAEVRAIKKYPFNLAFHEEK